MPGGRLPETENKEYVKFLAQKEVTVVWEIYVVVALYERVFETVFDWDTKRWFVKWSHAGGGRLQEVVAMRELTVPLFPWINVFFWGTLVFTKSCNNN